MIVKIQQSIATNSPTKMMLLYNKDKSIWYEAELTKEVESALKGKLKAYFNAVHNKKTGKVEILTDAEAQSW